MLLKGTVRKVNENARVKYVFTGGLYTQSNSELTVCNASFFSRFKIDPAVSGKNNQIKIEFSNIKLVQKDRETFCFPVIQNSSAFSIMSFCKFFHVLFVLILCSNFNKLKVNCILM